SKKPICTLTLTCKTCIDVQRATASPHSEKPADVVCASGQDTTWKDPWGGVLGKSGWEESPRWTSAPRVRSGWLPSSAGAPCG
uniref:Uncharacterized protein n=1 Tax=Takifugu rubripes TaxID=31033 RepID=A0A674MRI2_TAKRU